MGANKKYIASKFTVIIKIKLLKWAGKHPGKKGKNITI